MHRLFVGLRPPAWARDQLLSIMEGVPGARWQDDEQLHLTLRFIGEVDRTAAEDAVAALERITQPRPTLAVRGVGTFGRRGHPHSLWAGVALDRGLRTLQAKVERSVQQAGLAPEPRAFTPHITLARLGRSNGPVDGFLERHAALALPPFELDAFCLFESHLGQGGAMYTVVERFPLQ